MGRTQQGNNNAYVQDNPVSWLDWDLDPRQLALLAFTQKVAAIRRAHPSFRRRSFLKGEPSGRASTTKDATWIRPLREGEGDASSVGGGLLEMSVDDWERPRTAALALLLSGDGAGITDPDGSASRDDTFLLLFNAGIAPVRFRVPRLTAPVAPWRVLLDTADESPAPTEKNVDSGRTVELPGRSFLLLASQP
jgi:glycogen operon protein